MAEYKLTNEAVEDLTNIWNYTFDNWSEKQADTYYEMLLESCQLIADHPNIGKSYEEIKGNLRGLKAVRHIIFYRITDEHPIEITRILHDSMDLKSRLNE
jgi:toxin ParE1/3/4